MPKISPVNAEELIKVLAQEGFRVVRQKGAHVILMNAEKNRIVVPMHPGKDVKPGLTRAILKEAGLSRETFLKRLNKK